MSETEQRAGLELLLREPEIVAWLADYRRPAEETEDETDPPEAA